MDISVYVKKKRAGQERRKITSVKPGTSVSILREKGNDLIRVVEI